MFLTDFVTAYLVRVQRDSRKSELNPSELISEKGFTILEVHQNLKLMLKFILSNFRWKQAAIFIHNFNFMSQIAGGPSLTIREKAHFLINLWCSLMLYSLIIPLKHKAHL